MAVTPRGGYVPVLADVIVAGLVSFGSASVLLGFGRTVNEEEEEAAEAAYADATAKSAHNKLVKEQKLREEAGAEA